MIIEEMITVRKNWMFKGLSPSLVLLVALMMIVGAATATAQSATQYAEPINHGGMYLGPRLGIPFVLGIRGRYVAANDEKPVFYVDGDLATSVLINTASIGGGVYPLGSVLYVGAKYHALSTPLIDDPGATVGLFSFEVGASIALGERKNWLLLVDAGPILNPVAQQISSVTDRDILRVLPNVTLSIVGRLF